MRHLATNKLVYGIINLMLQRFLYSWLVNFLGLWLAASLFSGIQYSDKLRILIVASLIFGLVNALIRPLVIILSLPAIVLTLGLFTLVINAGMLYITSALYPKFSVNSIWAAIGAVTVVWLVNYIMTNVVREPQKQ